jgi:hypothetical protein
MVRSRLAPGALAWVDPDAELIILQDGLEPRVEREVLRQACAGLLGLWDLAPDTVPAQREVALRPDLRVLPGGLAGGDRNVG